MCVNLIFLSLYKLFLIGFYSVFSSILFSNTNSTMTSTSMTLDDPSVLFLLLIGGGDSLTTLSSEILWFLDIIETIFSHRKTNKERLIPNDRMTNAPVRFFSERRESLFLGDLCFRILTGFPSH